MLFRHQNVELVKRQFIGLFFPIKNVRFQETAGKKIIQNFENTRIPAPSHAQISANIIRVEGIMTAGPDWFRRHIKRASSAFPFIHERYIILSSDAINTLKEETFAERNFRDFREFRANSRKLFPRKILQRLIRESFFSRKKYENSKFAKFFKFFV